MVYVAAVPEGPLARKRRVCCWKKRRIAILGVLFRDAQDIASAAALTMMVRTLRSSKVVAYWRRVISSNLGCFQEPVGVIGCCCCLCAAGVTGVAGARVVVSCDDMLVSSRAV